MNTNSNTATMGRFEAGRARHVARAPILGAFALAQCQGATSGARRRRHSSYRDRESEIVAAIDPKRSIRPTAGRPLRSRTWRHRHVQTFSVDVPDHKNDVQDLEQDCSNAKEVASPYIRFMPFQELAPSRGWSIRFTPFSEGHRRSREVKFDALLAE